MDPIANLADSTLDTLDDIVEEALTNGLIEEDDLDEFYQKLIAQLKLRKNVR